MMPAQPQRSPPGGAQPMSGTRPPLADVAKRKKAKGAAFKRPDIARRVPPELKDWVDRIVAAGMKLMFSPETEKQRTEAIQSEEPAAINMAKNIAGLIVTLDRKSQGGIPPPAIPWAALELLGEAAEILIAAGQPVTQDDYNEAAVMLFVELGKRLGGADEEIMAAAQQATPGGGQVDEGEEVDEGMAPSQMPMMQGG